MKKPSIPKVGIIVVIFLILAALAYYYQRHWESVQVRTRWINDKIAAIAEGIDEEAVINILGKPDSVALGQRR